MEIQKGGSNTCNGNGDRCGKRLGHPGREAGNYEFYRCRQCDYDLCKICYDDGARIDRKVPKPSALQNDNLEKIIQKKCYLEKGTKFSGFEAI